MATFRSNFRFNPSARPLPLAGSSLGLGLPLSASNLRAGRPTAAEVAAAREAAAQAAAEQARLEKGWYISDRKTAILLTISLKFGRTSLSALELRLRIHVWKPFPYSGMLALQVRERSSP